jgi:hypothetical protein
MKKLTNTLVALAMAIALFSCEQDFGEFNRPNRPLIPLEFMNATSYGSDPFIVVSLSGEGEIQFEMSIPENSGRTIKEITSVAAGSTAINPGTLNSAGNYNESPILGNGNKVIFITSLEEFRQKRPNVSLNIGNSGFGEIAFIFLVTLDNNETIVSMRSRVRIVE